MSLRPITLPSSAFAGLLAGLLGVVTVVVPVPIGPAYEPGAPLLGLPSTGCFMLAYAEGKAGELLPASVRLTTTSDPSDDVIPNWYAADFSGSNRRVLDGRWRWITSDSLELRWHHSPSVRLSVRRQDVRGMAEPRGALPLFLGIFERRRTVRGAFTPCPRIATVPSNER